MSLDTRRFIRSTAGTSFWLGIVTLVFGAAQLAFAQSTAPQGGQIVVTPEVAFAWPIMVFIVAAAAVWAKMNGSINQHHGDKTIHLTQDEIAKEFPRRGECVLRHEADARTLQRIEENVKELRDAVLEPRK